MSTNSDHRYSEAKSAATTSPAAHRADPSTNLDGDNSQCHDDDQSLPIQDGLASESQSLPDDKRSSRPELEEPTEVPLVVESNRERLVREYHERNPEPHFRKGIDVAMDRGRILTELKPEMRHGEWSKFLRNELGISPRTATSYMRLYRGRDRLPEYFASKSAKSADLTISAAVRYLEQKQTRQPAESLPAAQHAATEPDKDEYTAGDGRVSEPDENGDDAENSDENTPKRSMASNSPTRVQPAPPSSSSKSPGVTSSDRDNGSERCAQKHTDTENQKYVEADKSDSDPRFDTILDLVRKAKIDAKNLLHEAQEDKRNTENLEKLCMRLGYATRWAKAAKQSWNGATTAPSTQNEG